MKEQVKLDETFSAAGGYCRHVKCAGGRLPGVPSTAAGNAGGARLCFTGRVRVWMSGPWGRSTARPVGKVSEPRACGM